MNSLRNDCRWKCGDREIIKLTLAITHWTQDWLKSTVLARTAGNHEDGLWGWAGGSGGSGGDQDGIIIIIINTSTAAVMLAAA